MTLLEAQKIVLKSIAKELNSSYLALYGDLNRGIFARDDIDEISSRIVDLESMMAYVKCEAEAIGKTTVRSVAQEVESIWRGDV